MDVGLNAGLFGLSFLSFFLKYAPRFWSQKVVYGKHGCFFFFSNSLRSPFFFIMLLEHLFLKVRASYTKQQSSFLLLPNS
jgi:hypothetical protein